MEKSTPTLNQIRSSPKNLKTKKKQQHPLKVVYITNPIKFKATASEFRALVQELTGQDADMSGTSTLFSSVHDGSVEEAKVVKEENVHAMDPYDDVFYKQDTIDGFVPAAAHDYSYRSSFDDAL